MKHWVCVECDKAYAKPGFCVACDTRLVLHHVAPPVLYHCRACKTVSSKRGKCANEGCEAFGQEFVRRSAGTGGSQHRVRA